MHNAKKLDEIVKSNIKFVSKTYIFFLITSCCHHDKHITGEAWLAFRFSFQPLIIRKKTMDLNLTASTDKIVSSLLAAVILSISFFGIDTCVS